MFIAKFKLNNETRYIKDIIKNEGKQYVVLENDEKYYLNYNFYPGIIKVPYFKIGVTVVYLDDVTELL